MNNEDEIAQRLVFRQYAEIAAEIVGVGSPVHEAAMNAADGAAGWDENFHVRVAELPKCKRRLVQRRMTKISRKKRAGAAQRYFQTGKI